MSDSTATPVTERNFAELFRVSDAVWSAFTSRLPEGVAADDLRAALTEAVRTFQAKAEDVLVRQARSRSWCTEFEAAIGQAFPQGPVNGYQWVDAEGTSCRGERTVRADGFSLDGYDRADRDADGYDRAGRDTHGWDREGRDTQGLTHDNPHRFVYDREGYDVDGFTFDGTVNRYMTRQSLAERREHPERFVHDSHGYTYEQWMSESSGIQRAYGPITPGTYTPNLWAERYRARAVGRAPWMDHVRTVPDGYDGETTPWVCPNCNHISNDYGCTPERCRY